MKKRILTGLFLISIVLLGACSKMLDVKNADGRVTMDEVWKLKNRASDYYENTLYKVLNVGFVYNNSALASWCDEAYDASAYANGAITRWYRGTTSPSNNPLLSYVDYWNNYYENIRQCNTFIDAMADPAKVPEKNYTETERIWWVAQTYIVRAYSYLQLIKRYGGVPIITTPYELTHDFSNDVRASFEQCVDQIMEDCDAAMALPLPDDPNAGAGLWWVRKEAQDSNMSRAIAWAIKSQAALYAASPLWYEAGSKYTWDKATEITKDALDLCLQNNYALYKTAPDPNIAQNAYAMYFLINPASNHRDEAETILKSRDRIEVWKWAGLPGNVGVERAGAGPTQELVDAYEIFDGNNAYPLLDPKKPYNDDKHLEPNYNPDLPAGLYDPNDPYKNRDPRFYASIYYNGAKRKLNEADGDANAVFTRVGGNCGIAEKTTDIMHTHTGYYMRKFNRSTSDRDHNDDGFARIFRLAELYLNFAEAAYNSAGPDAQVPSSVGGAAMSAVDAVNAVRARAGMPGLPGAMSRENFELRYRNERRIELAFEEHRFFDVRRWKILGQTDAYKTGMSIVGNTYTRISLEDTKSPTSQDNYLMFPINQSEVSKMMRLTGSNWQNPGW